MKKLLIIAGPTASGKSVLSMELSSLLPIEIISADSMQVYRYMNIGTDKASAKDRQLVRHHLIDIRNPDQQFSVEEFVKLAEMAMEECFSRGRIPVIVGGTGFYIRAFLKGYPLHDAPPDYEYRNKLRLLAQKEGPIRLHRILQKVDPQAAVCIHSNDIKRIIRALEYYKQTGRPISERLRQETKPKYEYRIIGLKWQRGDLYMRIDDRVKEQFRRGIIEETQGLLEMGYLPEHPGLQGLVYKETCQYLYGLVSLQECKELIKRNTRRYAKRQLTWFRKEEGMVWLECSQDTDWKYMADMVRLIYEKAES